MPVATGISGTPASITQLLFSQTVTTTVTGPVHNGCERYTSAEFYLSVATVTGSTPLFNVYIQTLLADGSTWQDLVHFTQATAATTERAFFVTSAATATAAVQTAGLAAATIKAGARLGHTIRVHVVAAGTTPSGVINIYGSFYE